MATAAELKARLAKYATPKLNATPVQDATKESIVLDAPQQRSVDAISSTNPSTVVQATGGTVVTDVQSTTLVIVERPIAVPDGHGGSDNSSASGTDLDTTNPIHQNFLQRLADLEAALLARDPLMKTHLGEIHKHMIQYEEISNLLRPHEIAKIMAAQQQHTGVILRAEVVGKSKAAAGKKAAKLGVNDL